MAGHSFYLVSVRSTPYHICFLVKLTLLLYLHRLLSLPSGRLLTEIPTSSLIKVIDSSLTSGAPTVTPTHALGISSAVSVISLLNTYSG